MKRVIVIGCPGSGKSTFSRKLHSITGLPLYYLDMMHWNADRTIVPKDVFQERLSCAMKENAWIIDGNYKSTMELRMKACDTVFFLDYPVEVCLGGINARKGKVREDIPWVEPVDEEDKEFIEVVKNYNVVNRPIVIDLLHKYSYKDIFVFRNRNEAEDYLSQM